MSHKLFHGLLYGESNSIQYILSLMTASSIEGFIEHVCSGMSKVERNVMSRSWIWKVHMYVYKSKGINKV